MTYMKMLQNYSEIKTSTPSYRLGQHICNTMGILAVSGEGSDLFYVEDDEDATEMFASLVERYHWDWNDLKCFKVNA